ncbi:MAG: HD domain-containing protein [Myxococcota bacterium]
MEVRDPLHGAIAVADDEVAVVDHAFVQRLRGVKQMGFSELPFPGAVHTRYAHSLGVMELAGRAFDSCFRRDPFVTRGRREVYRSLVRLAALCHDLGHAPFSHCTEFAMPPLRALGISAYAPAEVAARLDRTASHEDYTILVLTRSTLADTIAAHFPFTGRHVAALVSREVAVPDDLFEDGGQDYRRILSQLISSELDVDRLDYLGRDSYFSGARYGQVDVNWILSNLEWHVDGEGQVSLALDQRAIYAFDDFMIARLHMFMQVYFHHKSVVYEEMLRRHFTGPGCTYRFPADPEGYLETDDIHLHGYLRASQDEWARRIVERRPYGRALEVHGTEAEVNLTTALGRLAEAGIDAISAGSVGKLSRYNAMGRKRERAPRIYVVARNPGLGERVLALEQATRIFDRYQDERHIARIYVPEAQVEEARRVIRG